MDGYKYKGEQVRKINSATDVTKILPIAIYIVFYAHRNL
jgi:hypothetical protein